MPCLYYLNLFLTIVWGGQWPLSFVGLIRSIAELLGGFEATDVDISDADDNNKIGFSSI